MTTKAAAAVYNPHMKDESELPVIYGFNNGGGTFGYYGELVAEDGTSFPGHLCSSEAYMPHDLGILEGTSPEKHQLFKRHYPHGYRMEFVGYHQFEGHEKLKAACDLYEDKMEKPLGLN